MTSKEIRRYWDERAKNCPNSATTNDAWLRELEYRTLAKEIRKIKPETIVDIGCGDGQTTLKLARQFPAIQFTGIDFSTEMLELADRALEGSRYSGHAMSNVRFAEGDLAREIPASDLVVSCRSLINLPTSEAQQSVLKSLTKRKYALIENFIGPHLELNKLRKGLGLPEIKIQSHNLYLLSEDDSCGFADTYYFLTRVVYAYECFLRGEEPDYLSDRHRLAIEMPDVVDAKCAPMRLLIQSNIMKPDDYH